MSIVHNLDRCLDPYMSILPLLNMYSFFLSKSAVHPASHSCPIDRREPDAKFGKMCVVFPCCGKPCMSSSAMCVDRMRAEFGRRTSIPLFVG